MSGKSAPHGAAPSPIGRRRTTIAAFFDYISPFSGGYQAELRKELDAQCRARDINFLAVFGRALEEQNPKSAAYNSIYELFERGQVDGIVVLSTTLANHCGIDGLARFMRRFRDHPVSSLGIALPDVPSVVVDNRQGMEAIMEHVMDVHGARRIAFLEGAAGSPEALARYEIYRAALERRGIAVDPTLVASGSFQWSLGNAAMEELLSRSVRFDAVVAANDLMAMGALDALHKNGYRIPADMLVTGFDDIPEAITADPPLTTVAQPYAAMAERALLQVLHQIDGKAFEPTQALPARLIARRSCGCQARDHHRVADESVAEHARSPDCAPARARGTQPTDLPMREILSNLLGDLPIADPRRNVLDQYADWSTSDLTELWSDACDRVANARQRHHARSANATDTTVSSMIAIGERISVALDLQSFRQALVEVLPQTGLQTAFFSRFIDGSRSELELLVALLDGQSVDAQGAKFEAHALFPPGVFPAERRHALLVFPIVFDTEQLGVAVFENNENVHGYQMIRDQIATALKTVSLHQAILEQTTLHERHVQEQERMATTKRMQALSVLAGGVAHDLNNVLGPLVALPDIMIRVLDQSESNPDAMADLREDLKSIKGSSLRAAQTIKDLLTLSRQGRTTKEALDLGATVEGVVTGDSLRSIERLNERVRVIYEAPETPTIVRGSESHVGRAVTNLVRNAMEAIHGSGQVVVRVTSAKVAERRTGFEDIEPGDYAVLTVSDDGGGMTELDRARIFEPFFSQKRLSEQSGSGLGLAIVHSVVKEHDGFIDVTSSLGKGTTFTLYFPRAFEVITSEQPSAMLRRGNATILVLDDDRTQLRTCRRVLGHLGYTVDTMSNARQVCDRFAVAAASGQSPYDLVILDMVLHQSLDGLDVYQRIQEHFPKQRAIMVSGYAAIERAEAALQKGLSWVVKPYTAEVLAKAVEAALSERPSQRVTSLTSMLPART